MARFCDKCGHKLANEKGKFCERCGAEVKYESDSSAGGNVNIPVYTEEKSMTVAMILSFIFAGTGIAYAGNLEKGIGIFIVSIIMNIIALATAAGVPNKAIIVAYSGPLKLNNNVATNKAITGTIINLNDTVIIIGFANFLTDANSN